MSLMFGVISGDAQDIRNSPRGERALRIDQSTRAMSTITYEHHEIHSGSMFSLQTYNDALASASAINIVLTTPNTAEECHLIALFSGTGEFLWEIYESPTTAAGAAATPINHNRNSSSTASVTAVTAATINAVGTLIDRGYEGGGAGSGAHGGEDRGANEWILKLNTKYLFRITSQAADNEVNIKLTWYEHTPRS